MHMIVERLPSSEADQSIPSSQGLSLTLHRMGAICVLMIAQVLHMQEAKAESPQKKEVEHHTIAYHIQQLNDRDFTTRCAAEEAIIAYVDVSLEKQNPLPIDVHRLFDPAQPKISLEQKIRLQSVVKKAKEAILRKPGRILSPETLQLPLYKILEQQFNRSIIVGDSSLQERLESYSVGEDGQKSTEALYHLCTHLQCIPIFKSGYILLEPTHLSRALTINDTIICATNIVDGMTQHTVTYAPDKGVILSANSSEIPCSSIESKMHVQKILPWDTYYQSTPTPNMSIPSEKECKVWVGIDPQKVELPVEIYKHARLGPQTFSIHSIEQVNNQQHVIINGTIFSHLSWPLTTHPEDAITYQLVAANSIRAFDIEGREIPISTDDLSFSLRTFQMTITSPISIEKLEFYGFQSLEEQTIQIPQ